MSNSGQWLRGTVSDHKQVNGESGEDYPLVYPHFLHSGDYLRRLLTHEYGLQYRKHATPELREGVSALNTPEAIISYFNDTFGSDFSDIGEGQATEPLFGATLLDFYLKNDIARIQQDYPQPGVSTTEMARRLAVLQKNPQAVIEAYDDRFENMRNSTFNCAFDAHDSSFGYSCAGSSVIFRPVAKGEDTLADDVWLLPGVFYRGAYMPVLEGVEVWLASFTSDMSRVEIGTAFASGSDYKVRYHFIVDTQKNTGKTLHKFLRAFATIFGGAGTALSITAGGNHIADDDNLLPSIPGTQTSNWNWTRGTVTDHKQVTDEQGQQYPLVYPEFTRQFDRFFRDYLRGEVPATFSVSPLAGEAEPSLDSDDRLIAYFNETFATDYSIGTLAEAQFGPRYLIPRFDAQKDSELKGRSPLSDSQFNNRMESFRRNPRKVLEAFDKRFANLVVGKHYAALAAADSTLGYASAGAAVFKLTDRGGQQKAECVWLVPGLADEYTELPVLDGIETWWVLLSPDNAFADVGVQPLPAEAGWTHYKIVVDTTRNSGHSIHQLVHGLAGTTDIEVYRDGYPLLDNDELVTPSVGETVSEYVEPEWPAPALWMRGAIDNYKEVHGDDAHDYRLAAPEFLEKSEYLFEMLARGDFPDFPGLQGDVFGDPFLRDNNAIAQFIQDHYGYPVEEQNFREKVWGDSAGGDYFWREPSALDRLQSELDPILYERLLRLLQLNPDMVFNAYDNRFANLRVGRDLASLDAADSTFGYSCAGDVIFQLQAPAEETGRSLQATSRSADTTATNIHIVPGLYDDSKKRPSLAGIEVWTVSVDKEGKRAEVGMTALDATAYPTQFKVIVDTTKTTAAKLHELIKGKVTTVTEINLHGAALANDTSVIKPAVGALPDVGFTGDRHIYIDPYTGKSNWHIPVGRLVGSDGVAPVFEARIAPNPVIGSPELMRVIDFKRTEETIGSGSVNERVVKVLQLNEPLQLSDGKLIKVRFENAERIEGEDYVVEDRRSALVVTRKDGSVEVFKLHHFDSLIEKAASSVGEIYLSRLISNCGRELKFSWSRKKKEPRAFLDSVSDDVGVLMSLSWAVDNRDQVRGGLDKLVLFSGSNDEVSYEFTRGREDGQISVGSVTEGYSHSIKVSGKGVLDKRLYLINLEGKEKSYRINKLEFETVLTIPPATTGAKATEERRTQIESLTYQTDGKVSTYTIAPGAGIDALTETYNYDTQNQTSVNCSQGWLNVGKRVHTFENGRQTKESRVLAGVTYTTEQSMSVDKTRQVLTVISTQKIDSNSVEQVAYELDARGNLIKMIKGDVVTEWTYYNNYQKYLVKEDKKTVHDKSVFGWLLKPLDYLNPIGWGFHAFGSSGLTWGTGVDSTVSMNVSENNYAKVAFGLPLEVKYPGDVGGNSTHIESEFVYLKKGDKVHPQRLSYFGYGKLESASQKSVGRAHSVVPNLKLTVLEPDFERVDITSEQLAVAKAAAKPILDSLAKQKAAAKTEEAKKIGESIASLNKSLEAQSKVYGQGFKLKTKAAGSMHVEEIAYHTDATNKAAFGQVKSNTVYLLDGNGTAILGSRTVTNFDYTVDATDNRKVTTKVSVKGSKKEVEKQPVKEDGKDVVKEVEKEVLTAAATSSQTRSGFTGRLIESVDTEGCTTTLTYGTAGLLTKESVKQGDKILQETAHSVTVLTGGRYQHETHNTQSGSKSRVVTDVLGRDCETWLSADGTTWLKRTSMTYDARGRLATAIEYDYDGTGTKHSTRTVSWIYNSSDSKKCTVKYELKNAADTEVDSKSQVIEVTVNSQKVTSGTFTQERRYDISNRSLTETFAAGGTTAYLKAVSNFTADDQLQSVKQFSATPVAAVPASGSTPATPATIKEVELDSAVLSYTDAGLVSTITPKHRKATSYTYDRFGRQLTETSGSTVLSNTYSSASLAAVATAGSIKEGSAAAIALGNQTVDSLGRLGKRTINGVENAFTYKGATDWTKTSEVAGPKALDGCTSSFDEKTLIYSESCPHVVKKDETKIFTSTTALSQSGKALSFTDVAGNTTEYQYDAYGRQTGSKSSVCEAKFEYADNGLLQKETIKDVKTSQTMTVTYGYDLRGNETLRTFTCDGFDTLSVARDLLGDGRLKKSTLKVQGTERRSDNYSYDDANRLKEWSCSGEDAPGDQLGKRYTKQVFSYDSLGNVKSRANTLVPTPTPTPTPTPAPAPAATPVAVTTTSTYAYDSTKPGALIKWDNDVQTVDDAGRQTKCAGRVITYHDNGQVNTYGVTSTADPEPYTFNYDDLGRVRGTTLGSRTETYHYRANKIYALHQINTKGSGYYGCYERSIVLLNDSPGCLLQQISTRAEENSKDTELNGTFELRDAAGSVFASLDLSTKTIKYYSYLPYGYRSLDVKAVTWLGFKGEPLNPMAMYYLGNGYRMYDPLLQHFQTPDNWSPFGAGGVAAYVYCGGDPVNFHDPSGHAAVAQYSRWEGMPLMYTTEFRIAVAVLGVLAAPFTGGGSLALAVAATGLAIISAGFEIASALLEESDPELSRTLGYVGLGFGLLSAGVAMGGAKLATTQIRRAGAANVREYSLGGGPRSSGVTGGGAAFEHVIGSPGATQLKIISHGRRIAPPFAMGYKGPTSLIAPKQTTMNFYTYNGFTAVINEDFPRLTIGSVIRGERKVIQSYVPGAKVPNYELREMVPKLKSTEEIPDHLRGPFRYAMRRQAADAKVDLVLINQPTSLSEVMDELAARGYHYSSVDNLYCRGPQRFGLWPDSMKKKIGKMISAYDDKYH